MAIDIGKARHANNRGSVEPAKRLSAMKGADKRDSQSLAWHKTNGHCSYCGAYLDPFKTFSIDHIHPIANGGTNDDENIVPCCRKCNSSKGIKSLEQFRTYMTKPKFSDEQVEYLKSVGVDFEKIRPKPIKFFFETYTEVPHVDSLP